MAHPFLFFTGYHTLRMLRSDAGEVLELCRRGGLVYRNLSFCEEHVCILCSPRTLRRLLPLLKDRNIAVTVSELKGLWGLLYRYRRRYGIFLGMLLFAATVFFSGRVVWNIRVEGNERVSDREVVEQLRICGLSVGTELSELNTAAVEHRMIILSDEISWISVNMMGTVAQVEVRESEPIPEQARWDAAELIASRGGTVEALEDIRGDLLVKIGDDVEEGDVLVGGVYQSENGERRYTEAKGKVFARTERAFSVQIPLQHEKKVYTGEVKTEKYLIFFEKEVKFFGNTGNCTDTCDTINTIEYVQLSKGVSLPFGIRTVRYFAYETAEAVYSEERVAEIAYYRLQCEMEQLPEDAMLVRKQITVERTPDMYILRCRAQYVENIAVAREIKIGADT